MSTKFGPELVMPGGDLHRVKIAFLYGADAVYVGLDKYSLRKAEVRFTIPEIKKAITLAHKLKKKLYVTFNIFAHDKHLLTIEKDMRQIASFRPDALIIADPGIVSIARRVAPKVPIHLSTQANTVNSEAVKFWLKMGIKRIVLGREVTLDEIKVIKKAAPKMELEIFVHGAMCISYSGRCLMSAALTGRSANLGECAQPCRWPYNLYIEDPSRINQLMKLEEGPNGAYVMNSKDLCLIEYLDKIVAAGVTGLKIEGRNKTDFYLASVGYIYRQGLELLSIGKLTPSAKVRLKNETESVTHRPYTTGFLFDKAKMGETFNDRSPIYGKRYIGFVESVGAKCAKMIVKHKLEINKQYCVLSPSGITNIKIMEMFDKDNTSIVVANPGETNKYVYIETNTPLINNSFIREV
jgi:putative protease